MDRHSLRRPAQSIVRCGAVAVVGMAAVLTSPAPPALAASVVTVTSTADGPPGACMSTGTGTCTLREAIIFANSNPGSTITLPNGHYTLTEAGNNEAGALTGDLDIHADVTINGSGPMTIIDGNNALFHDRVFDIYGGTGGTLDVAINSLTITNGAPSDMYGGGGAWISGDTHVTMTGVTLAGNKSVRGQGAGIDVEGFGARLDLIGSTLDHNLASTTTGGNTRGGGVFATGDSIVNIVNTTFNGNTAVGGPAGSVSSDVRGGEASGGALDVEGTATATIIGSTFASNLAWGGGGVAGPGFEAAAGYAFGGGIASRSFTAAVTIVNSSVVDNTALGGVGQAGAHGRGGDSRGGGIGVLVGPTLLNTTIARNAATPGSAPAGSELATGYGGGLYTQNAGGSLMNTIVASNSISPVTAYAGIDIFAFAPLSLDGANLIGVRDGGLLASAPPLSGTFVVPLDALLDSALGDHGGPTKTLSLRPGSPAIDAGDAAGCAAAGGVDQRGVPRPQPAGGRCDIGAYEYQYVPTSIALASSGNPAAIGQAVTFTASVSTVSGTPTGVVTLRDGNTSIGGGTLAGGVVTVTTAALAAGRHAITATYEGDTVFAPSTASLSQRVGLGSTEGLQFFPLPRPVRLLDTRPGFGAFVAPAAPLVANQPLALPGRFTIDGVTVPDSALALVGNATVDNSAGVPAGFATLWPHGSTLPLASNLNFVPGTVRPNSFTVGLGADGKFDLLSSQGGHFVIDITGYYAPPAAGGLYFHPLPQPVRLLDTRRGATAVVQPNAALSAGETLHLPGRFSAGGVTVPTSARALAGNATVDNTVNALPGFATLFPGDTPLPPTSNLNFALGTIAPNAFTVGLGPDGSFNLYSNTGGDFIVDVTGYYDDVPSGGLVFHALTQPVRELDTRPGSSAVVHPNVPVAAAGTINLPGSFSISGIDVPPASALVGNATVDNTINAPAGFATIYPGGGSLPLASNLNYTPGLTAPNAFIVAIGGDGTYNLYSQSSTNYIVDISGYFSTG